MCSDLLDGRPGVTPDIRVLDDATVLVIFPIPWVVGDGLRAQLVLRVDPAGNLFAALRRQGSVREWSDDPLPGG